MARSDEWENQERRPFEDWYFRYSNYTPRQPTRQRRGAGDHYGHGYTYDRNYTNEFDPDLELGGASDLYGPGRFPGYAGRRAAGFRGDEPDLEGRRRRSERGRGHPEDWRDRQAGQDWAWRSDPADRGSFYGQSPPEGRRRDRQAGTDANLESFGRRSGYYDRSRTGEDWGAGWQEEDLEEAAAWRELEWWRAPGPYSGIGPRNYRRSDERIREDICERLTRHGEIDASEVEIEVIEGEVTLRGTVERRREKHLAEDLVESVYGVGEVHNRLRVMEMSRGRRPGSGQTGGKLNLGAGDEGNPPESTGE